MVLKLYDIVTIILTTYMYESVILVVSIIFRALVDDIFKENDVECTGTLSYCEYMVSLFIP